MTNKEEQFKPLTETEVIPAIESAGQQYHQSTWQKYLALERLYCVYVSALQSPLVRDRIKAEYERGKGPKTSDPSNMVAYLGMFRADEVKYVKQRVSDVHILFCAAQAKRIDPNDFASWIKRSGGKSKLVRENGGSGKKSNAVGSLFASIREILNKGKADSRRLFSVSKPAIDFGTDEYAVQIVQRRSNGTYQACWAKVSKSNLDFAAAPTAKLTALPSKADLRAQGASASA